MKQRRILRAFGQGKRRWPVTREVTPDGLGCKPALLLWFLATDTEEYWKQTITEKYIKIQKFTC